MTRIVVIGRRSFLARRFLALTAHAGITAVGHDEVDRPGLLEGADVVVNFALDPRQMKEPYAAERDLDLALAQRLAPTATRYVMLSTRMVYGADEARGAVEAAATGLNVYGANKLETEARVRAVLGDRLTVLRVANVLGDDPAHGTRSFIHHVLGRLAAEGRIVYDISPFVRRDFVTDRYLARALDRACAEPCPGVFNVGSGLPLEVGHVAMWVLTGHGRGELHVTSPRHHDEFWLDMTRSRAVFGPPCTRDELEAACLELGRTLRP